MVLVFSFCKFALPDQKIPGRSTMWYLNGFISIAALNDSNETLVRFIEFVASNLWVKNGLSN